MTGPEKLYTRAEALRLGRRERCLTDGHRLECVLLTHQADGYIAMEVWRCEHCDVRVQLTYPD